MSSTHRSTWKSSWSALTTVRPTTPGRFSKSRRSETLGSVWSSTNKTAARGPLSAPRIAQMTGRYRRRAGLRPRVRPGRLSQAAQTDPRRTADAVFGSRFAASPRRRVLLYWHSLGNKFLTWIDQCSQRSQPHRHGDLLQGRDSRRPHRPYGWRASASASSPRSRPGWPSGEPASTRCRSPTADAVTPRERTLAGATAFRRLWLLLKFRFVDTRFSKRRPARTLSRRWRFRLESRPGLWLNSPTFLGKRVLEAGFGVREHNSVTCSTASS